MNDQLRNSFTFKARKLEKLANALNLFYDNEFNFLCGFRNDFNLYIDNPTGLLKPAIIMSIKKNDNTINLDDINDFIKKERLIKKCIYKNHGLRLILNKRLMCIITMDKTLKQLDHFLNNFTILLQENGYQDCCQNCGAEKTSFRLINEGKFILCDNCYDVAGLLVDNNGISFDKKDGNFNLGIIGAICGAAVGSFFIIIFDQGGFMMSFAGLLMSFCTLKSYKLLATHNSKKGLITCLILMVLVSYHIHRLSWSITLADYYSTTTFIFFVNFIRLMFEGYVNIAYYLLELATLLIFIFIGSSPTIRDVFYNNSGRYTFNIKKE